MKRKTVLLIALLALGIGPITGQAKRLPSKAEIITHIREVYAMPSKVPMSLGKIQPSDLPALRKATLTIGQGEKAQRQTVYFSRDGQHYFLGEPRNMKVPPDKDRRSKIQLKGAPSMGPKDAPVTIVEYSDFQCSYCRRAHLALKDRLSLPKYENKVRVVFKHFPLSHIHPWAEPAAVAAACAAHQRPEAFWTFADAFFENQKEITKDKLRDKAMELADEAKLKKPEFIKCYDKQETLGGIQLDKKEGNRVGVASTPYFFINGHPVRGFGKFERLQALIDEMLAGKHP